MKSQNRIKKAQNSVDFLFRVFHDPLSVGYVQAAIEKTTAAIKETRHISESTCPPPEKTGWIERIFNLTEKGTDVRQETMAGITTFLTMAYIIFVNPQILSAAGMDAQAVFVTTCLIAAIGSIAMGLLANLPIAMAPAMGLNSYFAFFLVGSMGLRHCFLAAKYCSSSWSAGFKRCAGYEPVWRNPVGNAGKPV